MKRRTILSSILVIIACIAVISGTTFALFTSESSVNIAITSGKVNVVATLDNLECYSATADTTGLTDDEIADEAGKITSGPFAGTYYYDKLDGTTFTNKGKATIDPNQLLTLERVTPGDKVKVNVNIANNSNVKIQYRIRVNVVEGEDAVKSLKLFSGLKTKISGTEFSDVIRVTAWATIDENADITDVPVEIYLPLEAGNEYQNLRTQIKITVEAVQSNAHTASLDEINTILATSTVKNNTMYDAIQEVIADANSSYVEDDFYPYVWNVDTDRFYDESSVDGNFFYKYFKAYEAKPNVQTYSIYAKAGWDVAEVTGLTVGFDAGNATGITSVTYDRSNATYGREVIIRTNSAFTNLTVNAPLDVLYHYGETGTASINAIAGNSYHEYGKVAFLEISKGRVALEAVAEVSNIHIVSKKEVVNEVEQTTNTFDEIVIAIDENTTKPTFSRDDVEIAAQGTLVVAIQTGTEEITEDTQLDYVWLTKQGIFEQIKVSDNNETIEDAKWADDAELDNTNTQEAAIEIANNIGRADANDKKSEIKVEVAVTKEDANSIEETKTYKVILDENRDLVVVEKDDIQETPVATLDDTKSTVQIGTAEFTVALTSTNNNKEAELTVTNVSDTTEVHKADAVTNGGLSEDQITEVKTEVVDEAKIEEVSNDSKYVVRIGTKGYETLAEAIESSINGNIIILTDNVTESVSINKNITLDLDGYTISSVSNKAALTLYSLDEVTIRNGTINGQIKIGEHQYTVAKYKMDGTRMYHYHPLKPAENVLLIDLNIDSGDKVALYYTNIEDDLTRADHSNPTDRDLYGHYIYKTGYTSQSQYESHNRSEVFDIYEKKDKVTIINCSIESTKTLTGNMSSEQGVLYSDVLEVQSGSFNNDSLGRFIQSGKYLVGITSTKFEVSESIPNDYAAKINSVYYTYEGGANDAVVFANFGEILYLKENSNQEKEFGMDSILTVVYEQEGIEYTGAIPANKYTIGTRDSELIENGIEFYSYFHAVAAVYRTTNNTVSPAMTPENLVGTYATVAEAFAAANTNGQFSAVILLDNYESGDDAKYYYTDKARNAGAHSGSSVRFDLNGYTWTYTGNNYALVITTTSGSSSKDTVIIDTSAGKTGQILAPNGTCIYKENSSTENTRIKSGTFIAKKQAVYINKLSASGKSGKWYIEGGTFQSTTQAAIIMGWTHSSGLLKISGGTFISGGTAKSIANYIGTTIPVQLDGGTFNTDPTTYATNITIVSGKSAVDNGNGTWTIK